MDYMPGPAVWSNMVLHRGVRVAHTDTSKGVVSSEIGRMEKDFKIHHVVNNDLCMVIRLSARFEL